LKCLLKSSSVIWVHFTIDPANCPVAMCNVCDVKLSRGLTTFLVDISSLATFVLSGSGR